MSIKIDLNSDLDILKLRSQYPALANRLYFNYGGQGILSYSALAKIHQNFQHIESLGCFSGAANTWINSETANLKAAIATELQVLPGSISITENTTAGCNIALWSLDWQEGDHLLLSDCEHPGIVAIAMVLQARFGISFSYFPLLSTLNQASDNEIVELIQQHLQPRTRMLAISHICWNTGQGLPLQKICQACHAENVLVTVDAAQSVGVLPLNLAESEVDFYAFTGHKWWCGPLGVGGLYIRPEIFDSSLPTFVGWRSIKPSRENLQWRSDGQKFEVASSSYALYGALTEVITHTAHWSSQLQRYNRICEMSRYLWEKLQEIPKINCIKTSPPQAGLVAFTMQGHSPAVIMSNLETNYNIYIRSIPNPDCLRVSVHYFTTKDDIDRLIEILIAILHKL